MHLSEDWFYTHPSLTTPISVTHEILENGRQTTNKFRKRHQKQFNLNSYRSKTVNLEKDDESLMPKINEQFLVSSTYSRDFYAPYASICPPKTSIDNDVHPLFNRRPVNFFHMLPYAPGKFMDDHFLQPSETRKKIDFFRQIRQISYIDNIMK
ncbi:uncharacterized protein ACRADG_004611 [Cochliomyia hominivorax]